jgi:hypothetical protein
MRVDFDTSTSLILQQTVSGIGTFDGTDVGRAFVTSGIGNSAVTFKARRMGTDYDNYQARMIDPGQDNPSEVVTWDANANRLNVFLRRAAGVVTSTSAQVALAVQRAGLILTADYGGTGLGVVVPASAVLASGLDPTVTRNLQFKFAAPANAGRLTFDQASNVLIRQFEARLSASVLWKLELINLDEGLRELSSETVEHSTATSQNIIQVNMNLVLSPLRALKYTAAAQGVVRVVAHKEPNFPNA